MSHLFQHVAQILDAARKQVANTANVAMVQAYWQIGHVIVEEEQQGRHRAEYGANMMAYLAMKLTGEFGTGFTERNLYFMKQFYIAFPILNALRTELSWTHYRSFVLIDLKTRELRHEDVGQMDMYVRLYEDKYKAPDDNPTIGLILCTEKDHTVVKYSVLHESVQLFASRYMLYLPSEAELRAELERERALIEHDQKNEVLTPHD